MATATIKLVKEINTLTVLNIIREQETISRVDIVKQTKLAFPTVMRIVDSFIEMNLVREVGKGESDVGRKPTLLSLNKDAFYVIGVIVHATLDVSIIDLQSNILAKWSEPISSNQDSSEQIDRIIDVVQMVLANSRIDKNKIKGLGVGMPGTDFKATKAIEDLQLAGWEKKLNVKKILEDQLNINVSVDNISRTLAYGEVFYGWGRKYKDFVYLMVDFGVSGSIVQNSIILSGKNNVAGEYGHTSIDPINGRECYCGNLGCIESYISRVAIVNIIKERIDESSYVFKTLKENIHQTNFDVVVEALNQGDELVIEVFREVGQILGYFLANIVNAINPPVIVLGGSVIESTPMIIEEAETVLKNSIFSNKARKTKLLKTALSSEKQLLGTTTRVILDTLNKKVRENGKR